MFEEVLLWQNPPFARFLFVFLRVISTLCSKRLAATRWPDAETPSDWTQGLPWPMPKSSVTTGKMIISGESARRTSTVFTFLTELDGLDIHFIHVQSAEAQARPLLMTHGWPGSVWSSTK